MGLSNVDQVILKEEQPLMRIERTIPREVVHEVLSPRWEVAVIASSGYNNQLHKVRMVWTYISNCGLLVMSEWTLLKVAWTY